MNTPAFPHFDGMSNNSADIFRIPRRVLIRKASLVHETTDDYDSDIFCFSTQTIWRSGCRGHGGETWGPLFSISEACAVRIIWTSCLRHRTGSEDFDVHLELEIHLAYSVPANLYCIMAHNPVVTIMNTEESHRSTVDKTRNPNRSKVCHLSNV